MICAIDPGLSGAIVFLNLNLKEVSFHTMPLENKEIDYESVLLYLNLSSAMHIYLERAVPFGMGRVSAFNYGRGFAAVELAVKHSKIGVTYIEAAKWTKVIHAGIDSNLKPKAKSEIALKRLMPWAVDKVPANKSGKLHDGCVDALLIAYYGSNLNR